MSAPAITVQRSVRRVQWARLAPRLALYGTIGLLAALGLRELVSPSQVKPPPVPRVQVPDGAAEGFATDFARAYLTYDAAHPDRREQTLADFAGGPIDADGGFSPPQRDSQQVYGAAVVQSRSPAANAWVYTVAAQTTNGPVHLTVPVQRDRDGYLHLTDYPGLVGPPAAKGADIPAAGRRVDDEALIAVVRRTLGNYVAGSDENLLADLAPQATVSTPSLPLRLDGMDDPTWVRNGRTVRAVVDAHTPDGGRLRLAYELDVKRGDRWYVSAIAQDPTR